jgi:hypothetical protein
MARIASFSEPVQSNSYLFAGFRRILPNNILLTFVNMRHFPNTFHGWRTFSPACCGNGTIREIRYSNSIAIFVKFGLHSLKVTGFVSGDVDTKRAGQPGIQRINFRENHELIFATGICWFLSSARGAGRVPLALSPHLR